MRTLSSSNIYSGNNVLRVLQVINQHVWYEDEHRPVAFWTKDKDDRYADFEMCVPFFCVDTIGLLLSPQVYSKNPKMQWGMYVNPALLHLEAREQKINTAEQDAGEAPHQK
jgi:hypothetical protein